MADKGYTSVITHMVWPHTATDAEWRFDKLYDALHWCDMVLDGTREAFPCSVGPQELVTYEGRLTPFMVVETWDDATNTRLDYRTYMVADKDVEMLRLLEPVKVEDLPGMKEDARHHVHPEW